MRVLATILDCMRTSNIQIEGIKVFAVACSVVKSVHFVNFMKKQDSSVLRTILVRLNDKSISNDEV